MLDCGLEVFGCDLGRVGCVLGGCATVKKKLSRCGTSVAHFSKNNRRHKGKTRFWHIFFDICGTSHIWYMKVQNKRNI